MKCLRIYADETGESHLVDIDIPLVPTEVFPEVPALDLSDQYTATSVRFAWVPAGIRVAGWHTTPVRQLVVWLTGWVEFETSDGERRRCEPGAVVLAEDTFGKGHMSRHPDEGQFLMFVPVPNGLSGDPSLEGIKRQILSTRAKDMPGLARRRAGGPSPAQSPSSALPVRKDDLLAGHPAGQQREEQRPEPD